MAEQSTEFGGASGNNNVWLTEYGATVQMVTYEAQNYWTTTGSFLLATTLLAGFIFATDPKSAQNWMRVVACILGSILSVTWVAAIMRSAQYANLRIHQARALEQAHSVSGFSLFTNGKHMADGETVTVADERFRLNWLARKVPTKYAGAVLPFTFLLIFLARATLIK